MDHLLKEKKGLFILLLIVFIFTEFLDLFFDKLFKLTLFHTLSQIFLYSSLYILVYLVFNRYYRQKINKLLPEDLINILNIIKNAEMKNTLLNQKKILSILNITKPTLKKKMNTLIDLNYITIEQKGNFKYYKLTPQGNSITK